MSPAKLPSYLLLLNGSHEAAEAAHFAWGLAAYNNANVLAQQVIDVPAIWHYLRFTLPGFVGSGVVFEAEKKIAEALRAMAETVSLSYLTQAEGHQISVEPCIDEGDFVSEIARRALDHDVVIIGRTESESDSQTNGLLLKLIDECHKPIVFVNVDSISPKDTYISIANSDLDGKAVDVVMQYAKSINVTVGERVASATRLN